MSVCDLTPDSGLTPADACFAINDGSPNFWESPDIVLKASDGRSDVAITGTGNTFTINVYKICQQTSVSRVRVQLYVSDPGLLPPNPPDPSLTLAQSTRIFNETIPVDNFNQQPLPNRPQTPATATMAKVLGTWNPDNNDPGQKPGHKCLIARCYPNTILPDDLCFHVQGDLHVAQRNIGIELMKIGKVVQFPLWSANSNLEDSSATIQAVANLNPSEAALSPLLPSLEKIEGFRQVVKTIPERLSLNLPDSLAPIIRDRTRPEMVVNPGEEYSRFRFRELWQYINQDGGFSFRRFRDVVFNPSLVLRHFLNLESRRPLSGAFSGAPAFVPTYQADVRLCPRQVFDFNVQIELPPSSKPGDAHIFYITHHDAQGQVLGGFTLVAIAT